MVWAFLAGGARDPACAHFSCPGRGALLLLPAQPLPHGGRAPRDRGARPLHPDLPFAPLDGALRARHTRQGVWGDRRGGRGRKAWPHPSPQAPQRAPDVRGAEERDARKSQERPGGAPRGCRPPHPGTTPPRRPMRAPHDRDAQRLPCPAKAQRSGRAKTRPHPQAHPPRDSAPRAAPPPPHPPHRALQ